jgi:hypothetical protein
MHMHLFYFAAALAVIAVRAGRDNIRPFVPAAHMTRDHMVNRHAPVTFAAILTGIIVASKYLTTRQLDARPWTMDLHLQPNDRWARDHLFYSFYVTASVHDHIGFARQE